MVKVIQKYGKYELSERDGELFVWDTILLKKVWKDSDNRSVSMHFLLNLIYNEGQDEKSNSIKKALGLK